jgi:hypothetical protein
MENSNSNCQIKLHFDTAKEAFDYVNNVLRPTYGVLGNLHSTILKENNELSYKNYVKSRFDTCKPTYVHKGSQKFKGSSTYDQYCFIEDYLIGKDLENIKFVSSNTPNSFTKIDKFYNSIRSGSHVYARCENGDFIDFGMGIKSIDYDNNVVEYFPFDNSNSLVSHYILTFTHDSEF